MDRLIYVENDYDGRYGKFWGELGDVISDRDLYLHRPQDFSLVCFTGGEDVSPELYDHKNLGSHNSPRRDEEEQNVYDVAAKWKTPMTGICRGSQFLNVMCGGTMVQNLKASHGGSPHQCHTSDSETVEDTFEVTSSHHQMSVLGEGGEYLAWSQEAIAIKDCVYDGNLSQQNCLWVQPPVPIEELRVTEAFAYPDVNIFAVQHHPEWQDINSEAAQWTLNMIRTHCFEESTEATS